MATLLYSGHCFIRRRSLLSTVTMYAMLGIMGLTLLLTQSRGGWTATGISILFMVSVAFFHRGFRLPKRYLAYVGAISLVAFFIALSFKPVTQRALSVIKDDGNRISGREIAWGGTIDMIKKHPLIGVGAGNYATMFTQFQPPGGIKRFYEAHNDYLQFTAELGILFIPVALMFIFVLFKTGFQKLNHPSRQIRWLTLGGMGGVLALLIHSTGDFNLQIPSNALLFTMLAAQVAAPAPKVKKYISEKHHD
nr:O-antigen ligase family protein [uncultured Desulfobacter sp.]